MEKGLKKSDINLKENHPQKLIKIEKIVSRFRIFVSRLVSFKDKVPNRDIKIKLISLMAIIKTTYNGNKNAVISYTWSHLINDMKIKRSMFGVRKKNYKLP